MAQERTLTKATTSHFFSRLTRAFVIVLAALFAVQIIVAVTGFPQEGIEDWLSCWDMEIDHAPKYVFVIGNSMPSRIGLMNTYYAAEFGTKYPGVTYIIAMPVEGKLEQSDAWSLRNELVLRGIKSPDILFETKGVNTYHQVVQTRLLLGEKELSEPLLIVTAPLHMRRTYLCFREQGFTDVMVLPAKEEAGDVDLGAWTFFRYTFWYRLKFQAMIARELVALGGYKIKGWI